MLYIKILLLCKPNTKYFYELKSIFYRSITKTNKKCFLYKYFMKKIFKKNTIKKNFLSIYI